MQIKKTLGIIGLMLKKTPPSIPYYIPLPLPDKSIHTHMMYFDIDVLFVDRDWRIVDKKLMRPGEKYTPIFPKKVCGAIEFEAGKLNFYNIGDIISVN